MEKAHISAFNFENQRRTFHTYGYALDPSVNAEDNDGQSYVGDVQSAYDTNGKTVFESPRPKLKRKQDRNDQPEDVEGFTGPWGKYENEESVARPNDEQKAALDEILAKRHRRSRIPEEKPLEEKSILHSKLINSINCIKCFWENFLTFFSLNFSQRPIGLPRQIIFTCTTRCWRQSSFAFTSRQMLFAKSTHSFMDWSYERHFSDTACTENSSLTSIWQYGLSR